MRFFAGQGILKLFAGLAGLHVAAVGFCQPRDLAQNVAASTVIIVARLDQYIPEPESLDRMVEDKMRSSGGIAIGNAEGTVLETIQPRGTYVFAVSGTLKGQPSPLLRVRLPRVSSYNSRIDGSAPRIPLKGRYVLLLVGDEQRGFSPIGENPLPISAKADLPKEPIAAQDGAALTSAVIRLFAESLSDPATRSTATHLLRDVQNDAALSALRPYADDPDEGLRFAALECMATNQDLSAIPRIINSKSSDPRDKRNPMLGALGKYTTPEAAPALYQVLIDPDLQLAHMTVAQTLRRMPMDAGAIPFWLQALHDNDPQGIVSYDAYNSLHRLIPSLGVPGTVREFHANKEAEIKKLEDWWADERAGKHIGQDKPMN